MFSDLPKSKQVLTYVLGDNASSNNFILQVNVEVIFLSCKKYGTIFNLIFLNLENRITV